MSIYLRCPFCKSDQNIRNRICKKCGKSLPKQNKTYRVVVKHNGRVVTKQIPNSLELAKQIETKIKGELIGGEYYDRKELKKQQTIYSEFMEKKYLPYAKDAKEKKSYSREEELYRVWIKPVIGNKPLNKISPFDIEKVKKSMKDKAPRTIQYALAVIRHSLNKAKHWGYFTGDNPVSMVKMPKINNRRLRFLTVEEATALLNECKKRSKQLYEICLLSLSCGLRAGEIFNLTFKDIDINNSIIAIRDPKNGEDRAVYMTDEVKSILEGKQGDSDELVFKDTKGNKIKEISKTFFSVVNDLGLNEGKEDTKNKVVFHTLRHTFASWLAIAGTPIFTIKELLGHKNLAMTERYSHLSPGAKKEAVKEVEKAFKGLEKKSEDKIILFGDSDN